MFGVADEPVAITDEPGTSNGERGSPEVAQFRPSVGGG